MNIFLGIMAAVFGVFVLGENDNSKRETYAWCFGISALGMVVLKLIPIMM